MKFWKKNSPIAWITYAILLFFAMFYFRYVWQWLTALLNILMPFLVGASIAFILNIPMSFIERNLHKLFRRKKRSKWIRPIALVLTMAIVVGVIGLILFLAIPQFSATFKNIADSFPGFVDRVQVWANTLPLDWDNIWTNLESGIPDFNQIGDYIVSFTQTSLGGMLSSFAGVVSSVGQSIFNIVIGIIFSIYILISKEKLSSQLKRVCRAYLSKDKAAYIMKLAHLSHKTFSSFFTGQCLEAVILGLLFFITMTILRLPYALLVSCIIAVMALIPIVGAFIGCIVGAFLILIVDPMQAIVFVIMFLVLQQVEGNLIYPHVVGNSVGLPSIWVIVAVTVGGSLFGIVGMLVFIPLLSVAYSLFRESVKKRIANKAEKEKS